MWPRSASELYRPSNRPFLAKSVATFAEGVARSAQQIPTAVFSISRPDFMPD
jgi:hypothetical protein